MKFFRSVFPLFLKYCSSENSLNNFHDNELSLKIQGALTELYAEQKIQPELFIREFYDDEDFAEGGSGEESGDGSGDETTTSSILSTTFAPTENSSSAPIDFTSEHPPESPSATEQPEKCGKTFVSSTTGIITLTVVSVLSVFYIGASVVFIVKFFSVFKTIIIISSIIIFELVMVLVYFTVLGSDCPEDGISPALGGGLIGASIFVWLALTIGMYIFQSRRKVTEKNVAFAISDVTSDDSVSMTRYANPYDD